MRRWHASANRTSSTPTREASSPAPPSPDDWPAGVIDAEGYLKITDRIKDVIKSGGEGISSLEIEDLLLKHPMVAEATVIGIPDRKWGERPLALVVLQSGRIEDGAEKELKHHLKSFAERGIISPYAVPDRVQFVAFLPKTSVGKLNKKAMRETFVREPDDQNA